MTTHGRIIVALRLYEANIHNPNFTIGLPLCWISQDIAKAIHLSKKGNALMAKLQRVARRCNPVAVKARNMGLTLLIPPKSGFKEPLKTATEGELPHLPYHSPQQPSISNPLVSADLKSGGKDSTPVHLRPGDDPKTPPEQKDVHARSRQAFPFWTPRENCPLPRPYEMSLVPSSIISELFTPVELAQDGCNCEFCGEECFWYYYHEY
ncbi:hypothetical protein M501DRAFT_1012649 [Patellaria atrata CBS 101060]|uniref:Uncharacterized protein n=1 Tax=Patellaria atrata CBS 101060 TaxID=1346257 RepID=A0A9P4SK47_9PEZI|nr:hypothetical protein M501DRAFT_1012649 [Patellaria atrata CBS 101060]